MKELEATLRGKIKEIYIKCKNAEATRKLEKKLQGSEFQRNHGEPALHGQFKEPVIKFIKKDSDKDKLEVILYIRIKDLEKHLQSKEKKLRAD